MEWAVDFIPSVEKDEVKLIRDTLEAKLKAEAGQYGEAARILWELLVQLRHNKNRRWECLTMVHMGKVYRALRWSIALSLFEDALELAESLDFSEAKLMALTELGEMKCHWGQFEDSLELFDKAFELLEDSDLKNRRILLLNKVIAYEGLDEIDRCQELLEEVLEIDRTIGCEDMEEDLAHYRRLTNGNSTQPGSG